MLGQNLIVGQNLMVGHVLLGVKVMRAILQCHLTHTFYFDALGLLSFGNGEDLSRFIQFTPLGPKFAECL